MENLRNFPELLQTGEEVVATEKLHGTNQRTGLIEGQWMAGSRTLRRQETATPASNLYWYPSTLPPVRALLEHFAALGHQHVVLFGEVFGSKVQNLSYGKTNGNLGFAVFDLYVDGKYLDFAEFHAICTAKGVPMVPIIFRGPFDIEAIKAASTGPTTVGDQDHIREGVVVKPIVERTDPKIGRVILKYLNDDYLLKKEAGRVTDSTDM